MKKIILAFYALFLFQAGVAQEGKSFTSNVNLYVQGNSKLIGNTILGTHATKPMNDVDLSNEEVTMKFVDVDKDRRTYNSSQATLNLPAGASKIAYAGLYWSAFYPYEFGVLKSGGDAREYKGQGYRDQKIDLVLFKTPGADYKMIQGEIIFDSFKSGVFEDNIPYACYANVTSLLRKSSNRNGTYSVGDIKAAEGYIPGGSSGGWLLYVVYEDELDTPKYFTTFNGLVGVDKQAMEVVFDGFKAKETGIVNAALAIGALDGDSKLKTDEVAIRTSKTRTYQNIGNSVRQDNNFFTSSISTGPDLFTERTPNSSNTLGFDVVKIPIPNTDNEVIDNETTKASVRFQTDKDKFYVFFTAFETEINSNFYFDKTGAIATNQVKEDTTPGADAVVVSETKKEVATATKKAVAVVEKSEPVKKKVTPKGAEVLEKPIKEEKAAITKTEKTEPEVTEEISTEMVEEKEPIVSDAVVQTSKNNTSSEANKNAIAEEDNMINIVQITTSEKEITDKPEGVVNTKTTEVAAESNPLKTKKEESVVAKEEKVILEKNEKIEVAKKSPATEIVVETKKEKPVVAKEEKVEVEKEAKVEVAKKAPITEIAVETVKTPVKKEAETITKKEPEVVAKKVEEDVVKEADVAVAEASNKIEETPAEEGFIFRESKNIVTDNATAKDVATIPSLKKGYYLVTKEFSDANEEKIWTENLIDKGHEPLSYINPANGKTYVYVYFSDTPSYAYIKRNELRKLEYLKDISIVKVNLE
ncbi:hypothetical protein ATE92_1153 [Ulvibacter sp. MAR_2010_11]|uniref:hypothetical protein n=1 Tax=Ulvibacter sp. MAR_2010_11 TaxID=1250229 RepID=UPI000C2C6C70|nr:hypothetical protein [Ulvibacter sp. MAR_2010_11]PKA83007.1 hypothetical protein ATE92_1153 [Ulvibacter sp. MAR_2010_11]